MAHHGYQRPGQGYQTASCPGAKYLPFEADRSKLGAHIESLRRWELDETAALAAVANGSAPVVLRASDPDNYEPGMPMGRGRDRWDAIVDLCEQMRERGLLADPESMLF